MGVGCSDAEVQSSCQTEYIGGMGRQPQSTQQLKPFPHELLKVAQRRVRGSRVAN